MKLMLSTRRKFAIGCGAFASSTILDARFTFGDPASAVAPLPIPALIDAAKQGNAVRLKAMSGRHAFIEGKPTGTYGYSAPVLGPVVRVRRGDEVQVTVENALNTVTTVHWHGLLVPGYNDGCPLCANSGRYAVQPNNRLFNHLVCDSENLVGYRESERFGGRSINDQIEFSWLLNWNVSGFRPAQYLID